MRALFRHVLYADDDTGDLELMKEAFDEVSTDIQLTVANDGESLLLLLTSYPHIDLIILDLNMPCNDGISCLRCIRKIEKFDHIPVMIYTTIASIEAVESCYVHKANYFVVKPLRYDELIALANDIWQGNLDRYQVGNFLENPPYTYG